MPLVLAVQVERKSAEKERSRLAEAGLLDAAYMPARDEKFVYFAVLEAPAGMETADKKLQKRPGAGKPLREEIAGKLTAKEAAELVASFDIVGDIAVLEIPPALVKKEDLIAETVLKNHKNIRVVAKKTGGTAGEFRIRPVEVIKGEWRTSTVYREGGCEFALDLNTVYFSSRLGTERGRIAELVKAGENVLVPFAGVGPFAIRIAKKVPSANVVAIELNPSAVKYMVENIKRNDCPNIAPVLGDVRKVLPAEFAGWADRAMMPLPKDASGFLANVIPCLKKGGILHYYAFGKSHSPFEAAEKQVADSADSFGRKTAVVFRRVVRPYSKDTVQVVIDAKML